MGGVLGIGTSGCTVKQNQVSTKSDTKTVLRAKRDIIKGSQIVDDDVEMWEKPAKETPPPGSFVNRPEVILVDSYAVVDIPGETIILQKHISKTKPVSKVQSERWSQ
jgi:hypothetical protein